MNDHHFSYPIVVPLGAMTISGHSTNPAPPLGPRQAPRQLQTVVRRGAGALATPSTASRQPAWR